MKTGTQNRPYTAETLMVVATFVLPGGKIDTLTFNWNNRDEFRNFASQSDRIIREGGITTIIQVNSKT